MAIGEMIELNPSTTTDADASPDAGGAPAAATTPASSAAAGAAPVSRLAEQAAKLGAPSPAATTPAAAGEKVTTDLTPAELTAFVGLNRAKRDADARAAAAETKATAAEQRLAALEGRKLGVDDFVTALKDDPEAWLALCERMAGEPIAAEDDISKAALAKATAVEKRLDDEAKAAADAKTKADADAVAAAANALRDATYAEARDMIKAEGDRWYLSSRDSGAIDRAMTAAAGEIKKLGRNATDDEAKDLFTAALDDEEDALNVKEEERLGDRYRASQRAEGRYDRSRSPGVRPSGREPATRESPEPGRRPSTIDASLRGGPMRDNEPPKRALTVPEARARARQMFERSNRGS